MTSLRGCVTSSQPLTRTVDPRWRGSASSSRGRGSWAEEERGVGGAEPVGGGSREPQTQRERAVRCSCHLASQPRTQRLLPETREPLQPRRRARRPSRLAAASPAPRQPAAQPAALPLGRPLRTLAPVLCWPPLS